MKKKLLVFICPNCERFTYIPAENTIRICNHCSKMIKANPQNSILVKGLSEAYARVREYSKKGGKKRFFSEAGVRSEPLNDTTEDLEDFEIDLQSSRDERLFRILKNHCVKSTSLDYLHRMCVKAQLDWGWAGNRIANLASQGGVMFPSPWTIKYIMMDVQSHKKEKSRGFKGRKIVGTKLQQLFGELSEPVSEEYVYSRMKEHGYGREEVEAVLNDLVNEGYVIRPQPGYLRFIGYWRN